MKSASDSARMASSAEFNRLAELIDQHAACMWSMALCFFEDLDAAEEVVAALLVESAAAPYPMGKADFRREICRRMYLEGRRFEARARLPRSTPPPVADGITDSIAHVLLEALSGEQRTAFVLCWLGEHTYREAAELLSLPDRNVLQALWLGLQALQRSANSGQMRGWRSGQIPTPEGPSV